MSVRLNESQIKYLGINGKNLNYNLYVNGSFLSENTLISTHANGLRIVQGKYGFILRNDGSNVYFLLTAADDQYGGWNNLRPFSIDNNSGRVNLSNGVNIAYTNTSYALSTNSFISNSWVRTKGNTGWLSEDYGGGWHMSDSVWIRAYNDKKVYVSNTDGDAIYTSGGVKTHNGYVNICNNVTTTINSGNSSFTHYSTDATLGHWFNKTLYIQGNIYAGSSYNDKVICESTGVQVFSRSDIGTSPNFDNPGKNGLFEVRSTTETSGETGTKPFNSFGPMLNLKTPDNIAMLQLAAPSQGNLMFRAKQSGGVSMAGISWKTLLNSANYNEYAPTLTGIGASGNWNINAATATALTSNAGSATIPIYFSGGKPVQCNTTLGVNISGNAVTATTATTANRLAVYNNFAYTSGVQYYQGQPKMGTTDGLAYEGSSSNYKLWSFPAGGTAVDRTNNIANVQVMRFYWGSTYFTDLFISPNQADLWIRCVQNGTAYAWRKILDNNNYTSYTVTKTGSGASGTWGINVTGSAATLSNSNAGTLTWSGDYMLSSSTRPNAKLHFGIDTLYQHRGSAYHILLDEGNYTTWLVPKSGGTFTGKVAISYAHTGGGMFQLMSTGSNEASMDYAAGGTSYWVVGKGCGGTGNGTFAWYYVPGSKNVMTLTSAGALAITTLTTTTINMGGNINLSNTGTCYIGNGAADASPTVGGGLGNLVISSWWGISFTTSCTATYQNKTAIGFDCRTGTIRAAAVYGAVWNDYAEYRTTTAKVNPGRVVVENNDDTLSMSTERLMPGANIVSDTFGFAIGETDEAKTPLAVSGRVLAYPLEPREEYCAGDPVCSGPNGTVSKMTREEVMMYPDRIVGTVSSVPNYDTWGTGNVKVNGRIWIKVR